MKTGYALRLTDRHYAQAFSLFRRKSDQRALMLSWFEAHAAELLPPGPAAQVLSIGSGIGNFDLGIMPALLRQCGNAGYTALEPSTLMSLEFERKFQAALLPGIDLSIVNCRFEDYTPGGHFDLVHLTHSLYYMPHKVAAVRRALEITKLNGRLLIFNATATGVQEVRRRFLKAARGDEDDTFTCEELIALLNLLALRHAYELIPSRVDITACFEGPSLEGRLLLDFMLECDTTQLDPELQGRLLDYLRSAAQKAEQGRLLLPHPVGVLVLPGLGLAKSVDEPDQTQAAVLA